MKKTLKIVALAITGIIVLLGSLAEGSTALQFLPFMAYFVLAALDLTGKKINVWMLILAGLMVIINLSAPPSWVDVVMWAAIFGLYLK